MGRSSRSMRQGVLLSIVLAAAVGWAQPALSPDVTSTATTALEPAVAWVEQVCQWLTTGRLRQAVQAAEQVEPTWSRQPAVTSLLGVLEDVNEVLAERAASRRKAYQERMERLARMKSGKHATAPDPNEIADANEPVDDTFDPNDPNDLVMALAVLVDLSEYADREQRQAVLADPFVVDVLDRSLANAARAEAEGRWSDAYSQCYWWLREIDPNNSGYKTYTEDLLKKIQIAASFEDSPCETSAERYRGIEPAIFERAIKVLDMFYVSRIDYGQMAKDALGQCRLLTDVLLGLPEEVLANSSLDLDHRTDANAVNAWNVVLKTLVTEVEQGTTGVTMQDFLKLFHRVLELNRTTIVIPEPILVAQFSQASFASLDPHTYLVWPKEIEDFNQAMYNEFTGIGVEISKRMGQLTVGSLLLDTPAYRAGLDVDDVIEAVDGIPTKDLSLSCAVSKIKGPKGTTVTLTIRRKGVPEPFDVKITRGVIEVPTLQGWQRLADGHWRHFVDPNARIGYVRLTSFGRDTDEQFEAVVDDLEKRGMQGLILDLRWNPGGHLDTAVHIVDMFIKEGLIVSTRPGFGFSPQYELAHAEGTHPDYPLVVLINSGSASASEIVSGALSDEHYERAVLVGERTHGKGSVQMIRGEGLGGAQLKFTMAYYHLPSGQRVNSRDAMEKMGRTDWGVGPDVKLVLRTDEARRLYQVERRNTVLIQADRLENHKETPKPTLEETLQADPQLAMGLAIVKAELAQRRARPIESAVTAAVEP